MMMFISSTPSAEHVEFKRPKSMDKPGRRFFYDGLAIAVNDAEIRCALAAGIDPDKILCVAENDPRAWEPGHTPGNEVAPADAASAPQYGPRGMGGIRGQSVRPAATAPTPPSPTPVTENAGQIHPCGPHKNKPLFRRRT